MTNLMTNCLAILGSNPYGMTAATMAYEAKTSKAAATKALNALHAAGTLVSTKTGNNARMYSFPNTCGWSTYAAANPEACT